MELFSVIERKGGDLHIMLKSQPIYYNLQTSQTAGLAYEHISAHVSPNSQGTTIKRKVGLDGPNLKDSALFIKNTENRLIAPVFTRAFSHFEDRSLLQARPRDTIVSVGNLSVSDLACPILTVLLTDRDTVCPQIPGWSLSSTSFSSFKLALYLTFMNFPSTNFTATMYASTAKERVNGVVDSTIEYSSDGAESMPKSEIGENLYYCALTTGSLILKEACKLFPERTDAIYNHQIWFTGTTQSLAYGRMMRGEQIPIP